MEILRTCDMPRRNPITEGVAQTLDQSIAERAERQAEAAWGQGRRAGQPYSPASPITGDVYQPPRRGLIGLLIDKVLGL